MSKTENPDHLNYDYLPATVKTEKLGELMSFYRVFQWEEVRRRDDRQYDDIVHITFRRKHKIPHKDRIQLLQVNMETQLNSIAGLKKKQNAKSVTLGLIAGLSGCGLVAGGITLFIMTLSVIAIIFGVILSLWGLAVLLFSYPRIKNIYRRERCAFERKNESAQKDIASICAEAARLLGDKREK